MGFGVDQEDGEAKGGVAGAAGGSVASEAFWQIVGGPDVV